MITPAEHVDPITAELHKTAADHRSTLEQIKQLIARKAHVDQITLDHLAHHHPSKFVDVVKYAQEQGQSIDLTQKNNYGMNPLHVIANRAEHDTPSFDLTPIKDSVPSVKDALNQGNSQDDTPFDLAVRKGNAKAIRSFLDTEHITRTAIDKALEQEGLNSKVKKILEQQPVPIKKRVMDGLQSAWKATTKWFSKLGEKIAAPYRAWKKNRQNPSRDSSTKKYAKLPDAAPTANVTGLPIPQSIL